MILQLNLNGFLEFDQHSSSKVHLKGSKPCLRVFHQAKRLSSGVPVETPIFEGVKESDIRALLAENHFPEDGKLTLFNGQIISSKKDNNNENEIIKFQQLNIDLKNLVTTTIKEPKIQETSTIDHLNCLDKIYKINNTFFKNFSKKKVYYPDDSHAIFTKDLAKLESNLNITNVLLKRKRKFNINIKINEKIKL